MDDQKIRLALEILGSEGVAELRAQLSAVQAEGTELAAALGRDEISAAQFDAEMKRVAASTKNLEQVIRQLDAAQDEQTDELIHATDALIEQMKAEQRTADAKAETTRVTRAEADAVIASTDAMLKNIAANQQDAASLGKVTTSATAAAAAQRKVGDASVDAGKGAKQAQQGFLDITRAASDWATGGFLGVVNNLEGIGRAIPALLKNPMAMLAGLPAILTAVGTALYLFGDKAIAAFQKIYDAIKPEKPREFIDQLEALKKHIEELESKEIRLPIETRQLDEAKRKLDELKRGQAEYEAQQNKQNRYEAGSGRAIDEAITESETGAAEIGRKIAEAIRDKNLATSVTIPEAQRQKAEGEDELRTALELQKTAGSPEELAGYEQAEKFARRKIAEASERELKAREGIAKAAEAEYGTLLDRARKGHGEDQIDAQGKLADFLRSIGERTVANDVAANSPANVRKFTRAEEDFKLTQEERGKQADALNRQGAENEAPALKELEAAKREQKDEREDALRDLLASGQLFPQAPEPVKVEGKAGPAVEIAGRAGAPVEVQGKPGEPVEVPVKPPAPVRIEGEPGPAVQVAAVPPAPVDVPVNAPAPVEVQGRPGPAVQVNGKPGPVVEVKGKATAPPKPAPKPAQKHVSPPRKLRARRPVGVPEKPAAKPPEPPKPAAPVNQVEKLTEGLIAGGKRQGKRQEDLFNHVRDGIAHALEFALRDRGVAPDREQVEDKATQIAKQGIDRAEKGEEQGTKVRTDLEKDEVKRANEQEERAIEGSGIGDRAAAELARLRAAGGATDQHGRFHRLNEDQMFELVRRQVAQYLHRQIGQDQYGRAVRANPNLGAEETHDLSTRITATGKQELTKRLTGMSGQQLTNTQKLLGVAGQLDNEVAQLQQQVHQQKQQIDDLSRRTTSRQRNALKR